MPFISTQAPRRTKNLSWVTIALTVLLVPYSLFVVAAGFLMNFAFDACSDPTRSCNDDVGTILFYVNPTVALLAIAATITGVTLRNRVQRSTWWVPLTALGLMTALFFSNIALIDAATGTG